MTTKHALAEADREPESLQSKHDHLRTLLTQLTEKSHLYRTKAQSCLSSQIHSWSPNDIAKLESALIPLLDPEQEWETVFGAVTAAETCLNHSRNISFQETVLTAAGQLITHQEPRVRQAVASLIGTLATLCGTKTWKSLTPQLLSHVESNFSLDDSVRLREASAVAEREVDATAGSAKSASAMLHETEGWRSLETMLLALGRLIDGCGDGVFITAANGNAIEAVPEVGQMLEHVRRASAHPNRFVREAGLKLFTAIAAAAARVRTRAPQSVILPQVAQRSVATVRDGLQDNWSQVRFAASVAARTVLQGLSEVERTGLFPDLLPRMCLNRHYVAEGVRNYSQETWRTVVRSAGRTFLEDNIKQVIAFYESQCKADNHAVREAACQSLSEAALRLDRADVKDLVGRILGGLIVGFKDESWPVRDHACRSLAEVVSAFGPEAERTQRLGEMFELYSAHLCDNIPSVRANCAEAFVKCGLAFPDDHDVIGIVRIAEVARRLLKRIESQTESHDPSEDGKTKDTQYGASTKLAGDREHTDQVMYSCGSLAPRLRRGGGCTDHGFVRPKEGWEEADGGLLVWKCLMGSVRGRDLGVEMVGEVAAAGVCGGNKTFVGRSRFLGGVLRAVSGGSIDWRQLDEKSVLGIIQVTEFGITEGGSLKRDALECVRVMRGGLGVTAFAKLLARV